MTIDPGPAGANAIRAVLWSGMSVDLALIFSRRHCGIKRRADSADAPTNRFDLLANPQTHKRA